MIVNFEKKLDTLAELVVSIGVNVGEGDEVVISSIIDSAPFARALAKKAYEKGAKDVTVFWSDEEISRIRYRGSSQETLEDIPAWLAQSRIEVAEKKKCYIAISSGDPLAYEGIDAEKIAGASRALRRACAPFHRASMVNDIRWCVCSGATVGWAKRVFPALSEKVALEKLWTMIFKAMRVDKADPVKAWEQHGKRLLKRCRHLNRAQFESFEIKNGKGTDLVVKMPKDYRFFGGFEKSTDGVTFAANMPTEEVFSAPLRTGVDGKLVATMPLSRNGKLVENFWFTFENGKVVDYGAEKGKEVLDAIFATDEGAKYLGEIALVPYNSAIRNLETLFYNTLFDENASCHFALGRAYAAVKGAEKMTESQQLAAGLNQSVEHVDFMVGSEDLSVVGNFKDGNREVIIRNGNFVI